MYSNSLICDILKYINENINSKITIEDIENRYFYNRFYIMKLFKKELRLTIVEYINSMRIYNSILNIKNTNNNLLNIAYKNGFYSIEYFSEIFKKIIGVNPMVVKKYFRGNKGISYKNIEIINSSIVRLYEMKTMIDNYLLNQIPIQTKVKVLTIFKWFISKSLLIMYSIWYNCYKI